MMKRCVFLGFLLLMLFSTTSRAATRGLTILDRSGEPVGNYGASFALLVGVSDYTSGWPSLHSIPSELAEVETLLKERGFIVKKVMNPDSHELREAFERFVNLYGYVPDNRLLFYFSGHGYTRKNGSKGYLVPTDAPNPRMDERGFLRKALHMVDILAWARRMEARHVLFMFDSCFSGTIFKSRSLPGAPSYINNMTAKPVRMFITAGDAGQEVPAKSVFTPIFVNALRRGLGDLNRDGYISGTELGLYLQTEVAKYSKQTPQFGKISDYELSQGDFVFFPNQSVYSAIVTPPAPKIDPRPKPRPAPVRTGSLRIETKPTGADIYVNGEHMGKAPEKLSGLPVGEVTVSARMDGFEPLETVALVRGGKTEFVGLELEKLHFDLAPGHLYVSTHPRDAHVRLLNIKQPYVRGIDLTPGDYLLEISRTGYRTVRQWVKVRAGLDADVLVQLQRVETQTIVTSRPQRPPSAPPRNRDENIRIGPLQFRFGGGGRPPRRR